MTNRQIAAKYVEELFTVDLPALIDEMNGEDVERLCGKKGVRGTTITKMQGFARTMLAVPTKAAVKRANPAPKDPNAPKKPNPFAKKPAAPPA